MSLVGSISISQITHKKVVTILHYWAFLQRLLFVITISWLKSLYIFCSFNWAINKSKISNLEWALNVNNNLKEKGSRSRHKCFVTGTHSLLNKQFVASNPFYSIFNLKTSSLRGKLCIPPSVETGTKFFMPWSQIVLGANQMWHLPNAYKTSS